MLGLMGCRTSRCRRRETRLTDPKQDRFASGHAQSGSVTLSGRDLEDARRLFELLSKATRPDHGNGLARAIYERLQDETASLDYKARQILALRQRRVSMFGKAMFGEPAWDILLVLYTAGDGLSMNKLSELSGVSQATGLRWMHYLVDQKLIARESHPTDAISLRVRLTEKGKDSLDAYLSGVGDLPKP